MLRNTMNSFIEQVNTIALCFSLTTCQSGPTHSRRFPRATHALLLPLAALFVGLTGCGSGGYAGSGITSLSNSAITIDAGQSFQITAALTGTEAVSWSVASPSCSAAACGTLSGTTGVTTTYTAPAGLASQLKLTLTASLPGTNNSSVASITVNPDPAISGNPPAGTVGTAYKTTLTASGGTAPLKWSVAGSLPPGLTADSNFKCNNRFSFRL